MPTGSPAFLRAAYVTRTSKARRFRRLPRARRWHAPVPTESCALSMQISHHSIPPTALRLQCRSTICRLCSMSRSRSARRNQRSRSCSTSVRLPRPHSRSRATGLKIATRATYDGLTGLLTPRAFRTFLVQRLRDAPRLRIVPRLALLFLDTDHFKEWNDRFGHAAGDDLLRRLATMLRGHASGPEDSRRAQWWRRILSRVVRLREVARRHASR